jgi:hypothetical protein
MGSAASSGWENYHVAGKHMSITNVLLNNFIKLEIFFEITVGWMRISDSWISDNWEFTV